jgi:hypothetical protein
MQGGRETTATTTESEGRERGKGRGGDMGEEGGRGRERFYIHRV